MEKTLYVTDLDGTLLSSDSRVSPESAEMLNRVIGKGALFSIATARTPSTVASLMGGVKANLPFIVMTGAALWNPLTQRFSEKIILPQESAEKVLSIIRRHRLPAFAYRLTGEVIDIYHTGALSDTERRFIAERAGSAYKTFHIPADGCSVMPDPLTDIVLFYAMQPSLAVEAAFSDIRVSVDCTPISYHDMFGPETGILEVFAPTASKANAIRKLRRMTGATRIVAFGDNLNDIPMLREADVAVAVENAVEEVREIADIIIPANTTDSVARYITDDFSKAEGS